ncbi:S24/S26 family peptidase [uncultured Pseudoteredinibacter sp.]|uniref:S24/S26 family peptidase n=1 Tax=uncultured Pseudoteredinibacter sp. TaxID=1641701 RepID=UPI00344A65A2
MLKIFKITGNSMSPRFNDGDYLLLFTLRRKPRPGQFLVYDHPEIGPIFKQVGEVTQGGGLYLKSLNSAGVSSEDIGQCQTENIIGRMLWHFSP